MSSIPNGYERLHAIAIAEELVRRYNEQFGGVPAADAIRVEIEQAEMAPSLRDALAMLIPIAHLADEVETVGDCVKARAYVVLSVEPVPVPPPDWPVGGTDVERSLYEALAKIEDVYREVTVGLSHEEDPAGLRDLLARGLTAIVRDSTDDAEGEPRS